MEIHELFLQESIQLAVESMHRGGGPFGSVIVRDSIVVARGANESVLKFDATAHAEITAIRTAGFVLKRRILSDCVLYTSCEPCPMCLAACYWADIQKVIFASTSADAARYGFMDLSIYNEFSSGQNERRIKTINLLRTEGVQVFKEWEARGQNP